MNIFFKSKIFTIFGGFPILSGDAELVVEDGDGTAAGRAILLGIYGGSVAANGAIGRALIVGENLNGNVGDVEHFFVGEVRFLAENIANFFTAPVEQGQREIIKIAAEARCRPK
ncbi:MAG: hypothetical protein LBJ81_02675 [Puniceicoccales bacterium]|jgi:hypothetical protein|nr:hypothetical protein [Puniceicoccales bacterium]